MALTNYIETYIWDTNPLLPISIRTDQVAAFEPIPDKNGKGSIVTLVSGKYFMVNMSYTDVSKKIQIQA